MHKKRQQKMELNLNFEAIGGCFSMTCKTVSVADAFVTNYDINHLYNIRQKENKFFIFI